MRITTGIFYNDLLQNIQQNLEPMLTSQEQLSTGYKMNKPSDDPADLGTVLSLSSILDQNNSEASALTTQQSRLGETDTALGQVTNILNRAQTLVDEANNGTITSGDTKDMAKEVQQLLQETVDTANQTRGTGPGETFFNFDSSTLNVTQVYPSGSVSNNTVSNDTVDPNAIFWDTSVAGGPSSGTYSATTNNYTNPNVFQVLANVYNDLNTDNNGKFSTDITQLSDAVNWITTNRSQVGAVESRLQSQQTQLTNQNLSLTQLMAGFKDTDIESAAVKFSQEQATYQAALQTSSKVMQISLTNYLQI